MNAKHFYLLDVKCQSASWSGSLEEVWIRYKEAQEENSFLPRNQIKLISPHQACEDFLLYFILPTCQGGTFFPDGIQVPLMAWK